MFPFAMVFFGLAFFQYGHAKLAGGVLYVLQYVPLVIYISFPCFFSYSPIFFFLYRSIYLFPFLAVKKPLLHLFPCFLEATVVSLAGYGANTGCLKELLLQQPLSVRKRQSCRWRGVKLLVIWLLQLFLNWRVMNYNTVNDRTHSH